MKTLLFERISAVELRKLEYQKQTDEKLEQIFEYISEHEESSQKVFFDGQIYDAFSLIISLIQRADKEITLIDGYVDIGTLNLLSKKKQNVAVTIYTLKRTKLTKADVENYAGKKCFGINLIQDEGIIRDILQRLELETEE